MTGYQRMGAYPTRIIERFERVGDETFVVLEECAHRLRYYPLMFDDGTEIAPIGLPISCWQCGYVETKRQADEAFEKAKT